jgi:hypothetical protein
LKSDDEFPSECRLRGGNVMAEASARANDYGDGPADQQKTGPRRSIHCRILNKLV